MEDIRSLIEGLNKSPNITELAFLNSSANHVVLTDEMLQELSKLKYIQSLEIHNQRNLSRDGLTAIGNMASLKSLSLNGSEISDEVLSGLAGNNKIEELDLDYVEGITRKSAVDIIKSMPNLKYLCQTTENPSSANLNVDDALALAKALPKLENIRTFTDHGRGHEITPEDFDVYAYGRHADRSDLEILLNTFMISQKVEFQRAFNIAEKELVDQEETLLRKPEFRSFDNANDVEDFIKTLDAVKAKLPEEHPIHNFNPPELQTARKALELRDIFREREIKREQEKSGITETPSENLGVTQFIVGQPLISKRS